MTVLARTLKVSFTLLRCLSPTRTRAQYVVWSDQIMRINSPNVTSFRHFFFSFKLLLTVDLRKMQLSMLRTATFALLLVFVPAFVSGKFSARSHSLCIMQVDIQRISLHGSIQAATCFVRFVIDVDYRCVRA